MGKTVLVLSASPRKEGNSDILCDQFARGAREAGHHAEKIILGDKSITYCIGCETCMQNGGICIQDDDMQEILSKMIEADVIVLATPVYFFSMDAQLKTVIDRTVARYTEIENKEFYFIATAATNERQLLELTIDGLRGFISCLENAMEKGVVYGYGLWKKGDVNSKDTIDQAYEMGKRV